MRILKKYPNRRLYDTEQSQYVTLDDVRKMILGKDPVKVLDSKTGKDLTRSVLLQIIAEQEAEGHEPLLTNRVSNRWCASTATACRACSAAISSRAS